MRTILVTIVAAALAGCGPMGLQQVGSTPFSGNRLADTLSGKGAGMPLSCLPAGRHWQSQSLDGGGIAYRSGRQAYVQTFEGGCSQYDQPGTVLVTKVRGNGGMCQGDFAQIIDTSSGMNVGTCVIGPFIPYELGRKFR
jgi:hypothetical protein